MRYDAVVSVGMLWARASFRGSCFVTRERFALTAAHCVDGLAASEVVVRFVSNPPTEMRIQDIRRHPKADVALLDFGSNVFDRTKLLHPWLEPFVSQNGPLMGSEFIAFGYPEDVLGPKPSTPTARLFRGHIQRVFEHQSFAGYRYTAIELSIGVPGGMSGAPIMDERTRLVYGVAAENLESSTVLHSEEQLVEGGRPIKVYHRAVITYGVAVDLSALADWLPPDR